MLLTLDTVWKNGNLKMCFLGAADVGYASESKGPSVETLVLLFTDKFSECIGVYFDCYFSFDFGVLYPKG